ncbi:MAG TPA: trigger factor [Candidatus Polarisedimenticolia bacterium]|nr:trigger factor [Candidatus Polarisedimenticolia bacterium]
MAPDETVRDEAGLQVSVTDLAPARKSMAVRVPADQVAAEYDQSCRKYARSLKVPGFRQGKVPQHIIRQRFGREIEQETVEHVIEHALESAVKDAGLKPLRAPVLKEYAYKHGQPLTFTAEFEVLPEVRAQGTRDIRVKIAEPAVTDRMVSDALESLRERAARFDPVQGRGVQAGDHVLIDVSGRFEAGEGEPFERKNLLIDTGPAGPHPELAGPLHGAAPGENREFSVSYPGDHAAEQLAGRRVTYAVAVREIKTKRLPELDDEFARDLGTFATLEDLRRRVTEDLTERERRRAKDDARREAIEQLLRSNPDVPVPDVMVDEEADRRIDDLVRSMVAQGMDPRRLEVDWDDIREKQREPAARAVRTAILLDAIAREQKISIAPEALERAVAEEADRRREGREAFRAKLAKDGRLQRLEEQLLRERVLDILLGAANT